MELVLTDKQADYIDDKTRHLVILGSAGSGKTLFACIKVIMYALEHPKARIGVFRQTLPSLKKTAWLEIRKLLDKYQIIYKENKSYDELTLRVRGECQAEDYGQILSVVQPESKSHWLYQRFYIIKANDPDYKVVHFSYKENPYLSEDARKYYDSLKELDPDKYRTHTLGEWIVGSKQIFTNNWSVGVDRSYFKYYTAGVDFGWNVPSCFLLCGWYDDECYVLGEVYEPELTNEEFLSKIERLLHQFGLGFDDIDCVYADAASPDRIEVFNNNGLFTQPSVKDVNAKIETTRATKIHVSEKCENLIRELPEYQWRKDRLGNILDQPLKENDHAVDALCYNCYGVRGSLSDYTPSSNFDLDEIYIY